VESAAREALKKRIWRATLFIKGVIQKSINRSNADGDNPSLPGEPPKRVSGRLRDSVVATEPVDKNGDVVGYVGVNMKYARRLELGFVGTDRKGRRFNQKPRPFIRPAIANNKAAIQKILKERG
jgi:hypothetical protein